MIFTQPETPITTACDLFAGTTRVAYAIKQQGGIKVHSNDLATYSHEFGKAYIEGDKDAIDHGLLQKKIDHLNKLKGVDGFMTEHYAREARFFQEKNAIRIDAIRPEIENIADNEIERAILITSLLLAADKVDSTVATHLAYLKQWAKRSYNDMELVIPRLLRGTGSSSNMEAIKFVEEEDTSQYDLMYLDPPYKTVAYFRTYHIWETITRWDEPALEGVPNRRSDEKEMKTGFNSKKTVVDTMDTLIRNIDSKHILLSYSDEGDVTIDTITTILDNVGRSVTMVPISHNRYVGAKIGQNDKTGLRTGKIGGRAEGKVKKTNTEWLIWATQR